MNNTYTSLINKHDKCSAFILGAGPSLWYHTQDPFFSKIGDFGITISVNSSVMVCPDFDYWISNDSLCRRWSWWPLVKKGQGIKVVRNSWNKYKKDIGGFLSFDPRPTPANFIDPMDVGLAYCSSVPSAIDLSLQMGCKKIFLFGVDHSEVDGKHHFWQFYPLSKHPFSAPSVQDSWKRQNDLFDMNISAYTALKKFAEYKNAEIFNVTFIINDKQITKVDVFKIITSEDFYGML